MDDIQTATIDPATGEATEKTESGSTDRGTVAPHASKEESTNAGASQEDSDSGKANGTDTRRSFPSKNRTIFELRERLKQRDAEVQAINDRLAQFEQQLKRGQGQKPSRTFWESPEEVLDERLSGHLSEMEKRIMENLQQTRQADQETSDWKQETLEATKLIQDQLKLTVSEEDELAEMLRERPAVKSMRPMERADYAVYLWNREKGVADKGDLKRKAAHPIGTATGTGGPRIWTSASMNAELAKFPPDPRTWTEEQTKQWNALDAEFKLASRQGRMKP